MTAARCAAAARCRDAETVDGDDGEAVRLGRVLDRPGLCPECRTAVHYALVHLPLDTADITRVMTTADMTVRLRDPDVPAAPRIKLHAPIPLRVDLEALRALIDHETTSWADALAVTMRNAEWSPRRIRRARIGDRVRRACAMLDHRLDWFLDHPTLTYPARSLGGWRGDGHDHDTATVEPGEVWCRRTGAEAALVLLDLHERAQRVCGRDDGARDRSPCPFCGLVALRRDHRAGRLTCRGCRRTVSDDQFDAFLSVVDTVLAGGPVAS